MMAGMNRPTKKCDLCSHSSAAHVDGMRCALCECTSERREVDGLASESDLAFGQWQMPIHGLLLYIIDNEIHHRGQGYVYLRALGIEPPPFYERV